MVSHLTQRIIQRKAAIITAAATPPIFAPAPDLDAAPVNVVRPLVVATVIAPVVLVATVPFPNPNVLVIAPAFEPEPEPESDPDPDPDPELEPELPDPELEPELPVSTALAVVEAAGTRAATPVDPEAVIVENTT